MATASAFKFRGRELGETEIAEIRALISEHPSASRRALSARLCEAWRWTQPNGQPCDMVARGLMLGLHRAGLIELPPVRFRPRNNVIARRAPAPVEVDQAAVTGSLAELGPISLELVRRGPHERMYDGLVETHHYLAYSRPVGAHLKYLAWARGRPIACLAWGSAPRHLGPRDRFIGWSAEARRRNIRLLAYNTRFLILPWIRVPHLASHLLARGARALAADWQRVYGHPVHYLETFIDPARFAGTCYRAANWIGLGLTTGRGHNARTKATDQPKKQVLGYPLTPRFRELLARLD